jgi:hypothetical protein
MLKKVQQRLKDERSSGRDPHMFRPPNVKQGETKKFRFVVLPGVIKGDKCIDGTVSRTLGGMKVPEDPDERLMTIPFCEKGGQHWIQGRPYECPRLFDNDECPWCELGFELRNQTDLEEERRRISRLYLPRPVFASNIYFPASKINPSDLHGKVLWYAMPKTIYDKMEECVMRSEEEGTKDPDEPLPYGFFYDPEDCLMFQLEVGHKGGYNNYDNSKFLVKRLRLAETNDEIQSILDRRHDINAKFKPRDAKALGEMLAKLGKGGVSESKSKDAPKEKPKPKPEEDDDDSMPSSTKKKADAAEEPAPEPKKEEPKPAASVEDVDDPELKKLLSEVQDDM